MGGATPAGSERVTDVRITHIWRANRAEAARERRAPVFAWDVMRLEVLGRTRSLRAEPAGRALCRDLAAAQRPAAPYTSGRRVEGAMPTL
jgi:hypothetical protein